MTETVQWIDYTNLTEASETITDRFEDIEKDLWITDKAYQVSDDVKSTYFVFNSLKWQEWSEELERKYTQILRTHEELTERMFDSPKEYVENTMQLLVDLSTIELEDWTRLSDTLVGWWQEEADMAMARWAIKAWEILLEDAKQTLITLYSPETWPDIFEEIADWIMTAVNDPEQFFETLIELAKEEKHDIYRDIESMKERSTENWYKIQMSEYMTEWILVLLGSMVWTRKFDNVLGIFRKTKTSKKESKWEEKDETKKEKNERILAEITQRIDDFNTQSLNSLSQWVNHLDELVWIMTKKKAMFKAIDDPDRFSHFTKQINTLIQFMNKPDNKNAILWQISDRSITKKTIERYWEALANIENKILLIRGEEKIPKTDKLKFFKKTDIEWLNDMIKARK